MKRIQIFIDENVFNSAKRNSELKIEMLDGIDFCLLQREEFSFYLNLVTSLNGNNR